MFWLCWGGDLAFGSEKSRLCVNLAALFPLAFLLYLSSLFRTLRNLQLDRSEGVQIGAIRNFRQGLQVDAVLLRSDDRLFQLD